MGRTALARIVGLGSVGPADEVPGALDDLIFAANSGALSDAGLSIDRIDSVCMASSDLYDGRGISTMTLTAAAGSFAKNELKVGDDGLAALAVAVSQIRAGHAETVLVSAWSKLSDANHASIGILGAEPAYARPVGLNGDVLRALRCSRRSGVVTRVEAGALPGADAAVGLIVSASSPTASDAILGLGWSIGPYLGVDEPPLASVRKAVERALKEAALPPDEVTQVWTGTFQRFRDEDFLEGVGTQRARLHRVQPRGRELGYAGGLIALTAALREASTGVPVLVVGAAGLAEQCGYAAVVSGGSR